MSEKPEDWTDEDIIRGIKDDRLRAKTVHGVFTVLKWKETAVALLMKLGSNSQDAEEVAHDSFIDFFKNTLSGKFEGRSQLKSYFLGIAKYKWYKRVRGGRVSYPVELTGDFDFDPEVETMLTNESRASAFQEFLSKVGGRCKQIMLLVFWEDKSMKEVADLIEMSSADMVKKEAYRCRQRYKDYLLAHPIWLNRLKEE